MASLRTLLNKKGKSGHWLRRVLDQETEKLVQSWSPSSLNAIEISGTTWRKAKFKTYQSLQYPDFDICVPFEDWPAQQQKRLAESADVVLAEQVWEHLRYPYRAGKNVLRMLKPGGRFLVTTPFLLRIHGVEDYSDCSRWTPEGMSCLLEECGFDPAQTEAFSWGNKECAAAHINNEIWFQYQDGMNLENDPIYACVVWAVGRKSV